jgi:hypothetical protein
MERRVLFHEFFAFEEKEGHDMDWQVCANHRFQSPHESQKSHLVAVETRMRMLAGKFEEWVADGHLKVLLGDWGSHEKGANY